MQTAFLRLSVRFLDPLPMFHGRDESGNPEWPPSPLRIFQALVAAAAARWRGRGLPEQVAPALNWLATLTPEIVTPDIQRARTSYRLYVPHNAGDLMTAAWSRGDRQATMAMHRTAKDVWPTVMRPHCEEELAAIHYLYSLPPGGAVSNETQRVIIEAALSMTHLGHGIDMVTADAAVIDAGTAANLRGERWRPTEGGSMRTRVPQHDTLDGLNRRYEACLNRIGSHGFTPVMRLSQFRLVPYQTSTASVQRPCVVFELLQDDDSRFCYPQRKLIHIAGMVRHLAIEAMTNAPPGGVADDWVSTCVAGHFGPGDASHRQFSYLPLQSIGHAHVDPSVRRVMISAAPGDEHRLDHLANLLSGLRLKPTAQTRMTQAPTLVQVRAHNAVRGYIDPSNSWASATPVILPGYDDRKPAKTRRLIEKALRQAGVDQPCEFEWSPFSHFPKSLTAHKHDRSGCMTGYLRPNHLLNQAAVHLKLRFAAGSKIAGPLAIGSGRHCGLGVMAGIDPPG